MTLAEYAHAVRKRWLTIAVLALLGALAGYLFAQFTPEQYRSTGSVLITSTRGDSTAELTQGSAFVRDTIPSFVVLATSDVVLRPVIDELQMETTPARLGSLVSASAPLDSAVIEIAVVHGSAARAQEITRAVMESFAAQVSAVSPHTSSGDPTVEAKTIQFASLSRWAFAPNTRLLTAGGALAGFALGVLYALARRLVGDHIGGPRDVAELTPIPVLGQVLETRRDTTLARVTLQDPLSPEVESVRALAANLHFLRVDGGLESVVITSSDQGEGKSTLALALALVVAESGKRVLLIDADLRRPSIARSTELEGAVGLTDVLLGDVSFEDAVTPWGDPNLTFLMAGPVPPNPAQLLSSQSMDDLIATAEREFDLVIIDSGPVLSVSDTIWLSHAGSGALLVVRWGHTSRRRLSRALTALQHAEATVLGVALVRKPRRGVTRYEYAAEPSRDKSKGSSRRARRSGGSDAPAVRAGEARSAAP